jgi:hypothetical protein
MIKGLTNPAKTLLAACNPSVLLKISMLNPLKKDNIRSNQPGISKGSSNINSM